MILLFKIKKNNNNNKDGEYTFQVVLNKHGIIMFNYKKIPSTNISNINHTVKIGLSDAYIYYKILSTCNIKKKIIVKNESIINLKKIFLFLLSFILNYFQFKCI